MQPDEDLVETVEVTNTSTSSPKKSVSSSYQSSPHRCFQTPILLDKVKMKWRKGITDQTNKRSGGTTGIQKSQKAPCLKQKVAGNTRNKRNARQSAKTAQN